MSRANYATVEDIASLFRTLTTAEQTRATALLPIVSDRLRQEAVMVGKDLDDMVSHSEVLAATAKSVTVDIVARCLMTPTTSPAGGPMSQYSESALGYSASGTFLNPGGGLFVKNSELEVLGLRRQRFGVIEFYDN